ncbi:fibrobacter succinogenes major paralogous domain-containing protein [Riemerella anatipestifer]|nr:fibrobacter succinogenes major paralogous domain-containing protein [Riemerella anatipestifer]WPC16549.1 fibrobacter succinogenes major paralogous domain-containing protein [Riemerella anatipestifer]
MNGSNNPCPEGYHVPTNVEQEALHNSILGYTAGTNSFTRSTKMWNEINLRLPASGYRGILNGNVYIQSVGNLWSSNQNSNMYSWNLFFNSNNSNVGGNFYRANGYGIRCLHD